MKKLLALLTMTIVISGCGSESSTSSDVASFGGGGTCDETLLAQYQHFVYPFFRASNHCVNCHIEGGVGLGLFASSDVKISFAAFSAAGLTQVSYMATNPQHKPPYTGAQNQTAMNAITTEWTKDQRQYLDCVSKTENGGANESLLTSSKGAPTIYSSSNTTQTLMWDLNLAADVDETVNRSVPAQVTIDVRVLYQSGDAKGYIFSNPTLKLTDTTKQVLIEGIFFQINGQAITSQTTFTNLSRVVTGPTAIPLMNAQANTIIQPLSTQDRFQLYIRRIALTSGGGSNVPPQTPILKIADKDTGSITLLKSRNAAIAILRDAGIVRWCLSESAAKPASTDAPCANVAQGTGAINGWQVSRPLSADVSAGDGAKKLYLWVADANLLINDQPATVQITLDTQAPVPAVINSINVTDTQVGTIAISHSNEPDVKGWCIVEQNSIQPFPGTPLLNNSCWRWTDNNEKPTTIGFKSGGTRDVWIFVRDMAGNISGASAKATATNPFGAITFTDLTSSTASPRSVLTNRCFTCHGTSSNPGYHALRLFNYSDAVESADDGILVERINNVVSPMPNVNGGLMPQRERDLIRLWTMPEEGDDLLP